MRRLVLVLCSVVLVAACGGSDGGSDRSAGDALRVASFDFDESEILAEVYAQAAEGVGVTVERLGSVGPREVLAPAMRNAQVDLIVEYVGSALRFVGVEASPSDASTAAMLLAERVAEFGVDVLTPALAVDANVFVVSRENARRYDLEDISDLADAPLTRFGGPAECPDRPLCLAGLRDTYGLTFEEFVAHPSLAFTAEALRRDEIDVGLLFSTSPELDATDLVELADDRDLQPPENVVPLIRTTAAERWGPDLVEEIDRISGRLTTGDLRRLNGLVADGAAVADVAREWLATLD